jgi:hypothetical protein
MTRLTRTERMELGDPASLLVMTKPVASWNHREADASVHAADERAAHQHRTTAPFMPGVRPVVIAPRPSTFAEFTHHWR